MGTKIDSLWNGTHTVSGQRVTVKPASWNQQLAAGASVTVGFVTSGSGSPGNPTGCLINGVKCSVDQGATAQPSGRPTARPTVTATAAPTAPATSAAPTRTTAPSPTPTPTTPAPAPGGSGARFAPYVDTSLYPAYDLVDTAAKTGVKEFHLAFITSGGGCAPLWGGVTDLASDKVAAQIGALRAKGGDVRVSFGGAAGHELALNCATVDELAAAYGKVVDQYKLTKVDFDIEGAALPDTAANARRAQAIARLQKSHPGLDVAFTLPVMPEGLTQPGVALLADAKKNGVRVDAVNIMAMDYGPAVQRGHGAVRDPGRDGHPGPDQGCARALRRRGVEGRGRHADDRRERRHERDLHRRGRDAAGGVRGVEGNRPAGHVVLDARQAVRGGRRQLRRCHVQFDPPAAAGLHQGVRGAQVVALTYARTQEIASSSSRTRAAAPNGPRARRT